MKSMMLLKGYPGHARYLVQMLTIVKVGLEEYGVDYSSVGKRFIDSLRST